MRLPPFLPKALSDSELEKIYPLYNANEFKRLELQNSYPQYDIDTELDDKEVAFADGSHILDVGCGSGAITRKILKVNNKNKIQVSAIDINFDILKRMMNILNNEDQHKVKFIRDDARFLSLIANESADAYFCRFIFEYHPKHAQQIADSAFRVLKSGGSVTIIDADNVLLGLKTNNQMLTRDLAELKRKITNYTDDICAHIPRFLIKAGFKLSAPKAIPIIFFTQAEKLYEHQIYQQRFLQMKPTLLSFWPEERINRFIKMFLDEILKSETLIRYEKFVFHATKS